jgi:catechol 2,3-dioxygenase-like lactoylglutathione lyase family enzyme
MMRSKLLAAGLFGALMTTVAAAQTVPPMPDAIKAIRMSGVGLNVTDLEKSKAFYTDVLGFKVACRVPAQGPAQEYLLGFTGQVREDNLVVLRKGAVEPGARTFGRLLLVVPDGRKMAERVRASGVPQDRPLVDGTNFVRDPDGYLIELYQRPAAPAR